MPLCIYARLIQSISCIFSFQTGLSGTACHCRAGLRRCSATHAPTTLDLHAGSHREMVPKCRRKDLKAKVGAHNSDMLVLCSPLTRALETAVLASEQLGILTTGSNFQVCLPANPSGLN